VAAVEIDSPQIPFNVLDAELWVADAAYVEDWRENTHPPKQYPRGTIHSHAVTMNDGHTYPVIYGESRQPVSDIPVVFTTAWWTHTHGYNRHVLLRLMEHGFNGVLIGSEGTTHEPTNLSALARNLGSISLARSAQNMHGILDSVPDMHDQQTNRASLIGASRGAMVGMGVMHQALLDKHGRRIVRADLVAPCFPKKFDICDVPELVGQVLTEPQHVFSFLGKISIGTLVHYPSTIDPHPKSIAHHLATTSALFGGEAGELARGINRNQLLHITTFKGDFASMPRRWDEIFADYPNYTHDIHNGAHLSIANSKTMIALEQRMIHAFLSGLHIEV
jgi:hypothetical protein